MARRAKRKWTEMSLSKSCGQLFCGKLCAHIEHRNEADALLQKVGMENIAAECAEIQDTEDFFVMDVCESGGRIVIDFEMPFILCANNKYRIEATAAGRLDILNSAGYLYDSYDFAAMGKKELLSFGGIVSISSITYSDVELLGMFGKNIGERMAAFLEEAKSIRWFENSGRLNEKYNMVFLFIRRATGGENNIWKSGNLKFIHWKI